MNRDRNVQPQWDTLIDYSCIENRIIKDDAILVPPYDYKTLQEEKDEVDLTSVRPFLVKYEAHRNHKLNDYSESGQSALERAPGHDYFKTVWGV